MIKHAIINSLAVDLTALFSLEHKCRPEVCKDSYCCCSYFEVEVCRWELGVMAGMFPAASAFNRFLRKDYAMADIFKEQAHSNFSIQTNDDDFCILTYKGESDQPLCALHSAALERNVPPASVKPRCCSLWPLVVDDDEAIPVVTLHSDAFLFTCNTKRTAPNGGLDAGVAEIIESIWDRDFVLKIERAGRKFLVTSDS